MAEKSNIPSCSGCKSYCPLTKTSCQFGESQAIAGNFIKAENAVFTKPAKAKAPADVSAWQYDYTDRKKSGEMVTDIKISPTYSWQK